MQVRTMILQDASRNTPTVYYQLSFPHDDSAEENYDGVRIRDHRIRREKPRKEMNVAVNWLISRLVIEEGC